MGGEGSMTDYLMRLALGAEPVRLTDLGLNERGKAMNIYLASSWKNEELVMEWAARLRGAGYEVDAFCDDSRPNGRFVFHFSEIGDAGQLDAINFLADERSQKAFAEDKKWIDWADIALLILPAGKSSHLEAGYAVGGGKKLIIWQEKFPKGEFDVMYGFADLITDSIPEVLDFLERDPCFERKAP